MTALYPTLRTNEARYNEAGLYAKIRFFDTLDIKDGPHWIVWLSKCQLISQGDALYNASLTGACMDFYEKNQLFGFLTLKPRPESFNIALKFL